ncbi:3-hydroxy-9,10-secoandrosta-1,3,5(10)-triene-9,17-dione monooxygenase reductase subunit [Streptomyces sp. NRRL F-5053]|uniref:3-hydroxy-9,10-secoandrosta-1,3,5(10)-triene-9, 17-dione monooxygenase reductase subunit n=1 Tax=Streptomyces sp. NRRL F-5053 TaxID=1463854 RepID=UPI000A64EE91|nr:3-hydroxy-9,10-secoandrosta-1,3,5(10)-triene-9,17-dione monooxygenase reductase subunit [Streptomyces sp. NRRL F-5053]
MTPDASVALPQGGQLTAGPVDASRFRRVLGEFCTGVVVITAQAGGQPVGFACQSFSSLSLDPPLVLFCPTRTSRSWPVIAQAGHFGVNVLSAEQREISSVFGRPGREKFAALDWAPSPNGAPLLARALAWLDCTVETVHEAGDHHVVVGRVDGLAAGAATSPLLFHRGHYTTTTEQPDPWLPHPDLRTEPDSWF